jgi:translation initiation factor 2 subunit 3
MEERIPTPERDPTKPPRMYVVRSFDVNKPGTSAEKLRGGVIGGTILQGTFKTEDEIEIRPGVRVKKHEKSFYEPLLTEIVSMQAGGKSVKEARCGGLVGVGTLLDPSLTKADGLIGNLAGKPNMLPSTLSELSVDIHLFERAVGTKELITVDRIRKGETLLLDVGTAITVGTVVSVKGDAATLQLGRAVCAEEGFRTAINRKIAGRWRLIGYGIVKS